MYNEHFGLKRAPFRITPDTKLFYPGGNRGEILEALMYAVTSGEGIVKVVGEVGSGKTMLCRMLEERLADSVDIVYLANPSLSPEDTLHAIALEMKLDVAPGANRLQVMHALQERLLEKHAAGRQVVVFVEEAQSMPIATLEEIRLLSNLETNRDKLLQIVLFGQPELDRNLEQPDIRQLKERITHSFYLEAFTPEQMREYVNFRMRAVGYRGPDIFRGGAYRRLARASLGLTRRINILADKALLAAFAEDTFDVNKRHVNIAINDSQFVRTRRWGMPEIALVSGLILIVAAIAWTLLQRSDDFGAYLQKLRGTDDATEIAQSTARPTLASAEGTATGAGVDRPVDGLVTAGERRGTGGPVSAGAEAPADGASVPSEVEARDEASIAAPALPMAGGGSRLLLSDTLSKLPEAEAAVQPAVSVEPASPVTMAAADATEAIEVSASAADERSGAGNGREHAADGAAPAREVSSRDDVGPLTEARLAATRDWLQSADDSHFSIQLLLTDFARRDNLEKFLEERQAAGEVEDYYVFETRIRSNVWFGVLYKEYESFAAAKAALQELPEEFRYHQPFIRNVRDIATLG